MLLLALSACGLTLVTLILDIKKIITEQEQHTQVEHKRIGSHNVKNVINNDGAASNGTTSSAAVVEEQAKKYSSRADNDTNSSIATTTSDHCHNSAFRGK